jgi:plastocyanin
VRRGGLAVVVIGAITCGGSSSTTPSSAPSTSGGSSTSTNTITITSAGVSTRNIQIAVGTRVLFVNNDSRSHNMLSDPHPEHTDCPELNQVGFLSPGQSRETGNLVTARTCGFHDHDDFSVQSLQGQIVIK